MQKHIILRSLFGAYIAFGLLLIGVGTVHVVQASLPQDADEEIEIDMRVVQGTWTFDPEIIEVEAGTRVILHIENEDSFAHGFAISEFNVDERLPGGETTTVDFVASEGGEFEFYCSVYCGSGHFGQTGQLVVLGEGEAPADGVVSDDRDLPVRSHEDAIGTLPYTVDDDGVKVFEMTIEEIMWDYGDGNPIESWGFEGQLPGPEIRVTEGDDVRIKVTNEGPEATTVHWHGVDLVNEADGVPGYTQDPIEPGETFEYEFTAYPAGTRFYHSHGKDHATEADHVDMGLAGPFIIEPEDYVAPDVEHTMVLTERIDRGLFPIDGRVYPETENIRVREGDNVKIRMINAGSATFHPMHLHGHQFQVTASDGNPVPEAAQLTKNVQTVMPGETWDIDFLADNPGIWLFHCHELNHVAGGMATGVVYEDAISADFELQDQTGRTVTDQDFEGQYRLAAFGYTNCADTCPVTMNYLADVMDVLDPELAEKVQPMMISVDAERDTPERMAEYVAAFDDRILGLTGDQEQVAHALASFGAYASRNETTSAMGATYNHTHAIYLIGPQGEFIEWFTHDFRPENIASSIRQYERGDIEPLVASE